MSRDSDSVRKGMFFTRKEMKFLLRTLETYQRIVEDNISRWDKDSLEDMIASFKSNVEKF